MRAVNSSRVACGPHGHVVPCSRLVACRSAETSTVTQTKTIDLTFVTKEGPVVSASCESGETTLRTLMLANKVDLYTTWGKMWSCGGGGSCGTCIVEVTEGGELLTPRTRTEENKLKGKPAGWRLACQTKVGTGESCGAVTIRTKPQ